MAISLDAQGEYNYVLIKERSLPINQQTVWKIRPLKSRHWLRINSPDMIQAEGSQVIFVLRNSLIGWSNFLDRNGKETPFALDADGCASLESIDRIREDIKTEISLFASRLSFMTEEDAIKSDAPSSAT